MFYERFNDNDVGEEYWHCFPMMLRVMKAENNCWIDFSIHS